MKRLSSGVFVMLLALLLAQTAWSADVVIKGDGRLTAKLSYNARVAIVALSGGDYTNPATAMTNYATWCPSPSDTAPCLLKIMPGVYDIGTSSVAMQSYIDIEGSGENVTIIQGTVNSSSSGVVNGAGSAEVRFLSIQNLGGAGHTNAIAVYSNSAYYGFRLTNVTLHAEGADSNNYGYYNYYSNSIMTNVTVEAMGGTTTYGVYNIHYSYPTMNNVDVTAQSGTSNNYGVYNSHSGGTIKNSSITGHGGMTPGSSNGIYNINSSEQTISHSSVYGADNSLYNNSGCTFSVANSQISGGAAVANGGTFTCYGNYDASYTGLNSSCQ
jgi:hypothetical protein